MRSVARVLILSGSMVLVAGGLAWGGWLAGSEGSGPRMSPGPSAAAGNCAAVSARVPGTWNWFAGQVVTLMPDESAISRRKDGLQLNEGSWRCVGGRVVISWQRPGRQFEDTLILSADGNTLSGKNRSGGAVSGTRAPGGRTAGGSPGSVLETGTDRRGGDYRSFELNSTDPLVCQNACAAERRCRAWTYVGPGVQGPQARCWLKDSVPPARPASCCTSGVKNGGGQAAAGGGVKPSWVDPGYPGPGGPGGAAAGTGGCAGIAATVPGLWNWFGGQVVTLGADGSATSQRQDGLQLNEGFWSCVNGTVVIDWQRAGRSFDDTLTLSADGNRLSGTNQFGSPVSGVRATGSVPGAGTAGVPGPVPGWITADGRQDCIAGGTRRSGGLSCVAPVSIPDQGLCADPRTLSVIDSWLSRTIPWPGSQLDCWGRWYGQSRDGSASVRNNCLRPETDGRSRCQYILDHMRDIQSDQLGVPLGLYLDQNLR